MDHNPYAAPQSDFNTGATSLQWQQGMFWRSGALLMARNGAVLPPRCVKCNAAIDGSGKKRRFYWHHPAFFLLVLLNIIIYAAVAFAVRRNADVTFGLCPEHRRKRSRRVLAGVGGIFLGLGLFVAAIMANQPVLVLPGLLVMVAGIVVTAVMAQTLAPVRIDARVAHLKGCGEAFLANLPLPTSVAPVPAQQPWTAPS